MKTAEELLNEYKAANKKVIARYKVLMEDPEYVVALDLALAAWQAYVDDSGRFDTIS